MGITENGSSGLSSADIGIIVGTVNGIEISDLINTKINDYKGLIVYSSGFQGWS